MIQKIWLAGWTSDDCMQPASEEEVCGPPDRPGPHAHEATAHASCTDNLSILQIREHGHKKNNT